MIYYLIHCLLKKKLGDIAQTFLILDGPPAYRETVNHLVNLEQLILVISQRVFHPLHNSQYLLLF